MPRRRAKETRNKIKSSDLVMDQRSWPFVPLALRLHISRTCLVGLLKVKAAVVMSREGCRVETIQLIWFQSQLT